MTPTTFISSCLELLRLLDHPLLTSRRLLLRLGCCLGSAFHLLRCSWLVLLAQLQLAQLADSPTLCSTGFFVAFLPFVGLGFTDKLISRFNALVDVMKESLNYSLST